MRQYPNFNPNLNIKERIIRFVRNDNPTNRLIVINACVYLLIVLLRFFYDNPEKEVVNDFILRWFGVSPHLETFITRPWTLFTSLFLHLKFWHILFNMIVLWFSGWIFSQFISAKKIYWIYLCGGVFGNVIFILLYHYFPVFERFTAGTAAFGALGEFLRYWQPPQPKFPTILFDCSSLAKYA